MKSFNKYSILILFSTCFLLVLYKALTIPITHDECATTVHYLNFSYWEIMMYPDSWPNNHILNTISVKFLAGLFSKEQWVVRIPNLIGFWIYAYSIYLFLKIVFKPESKLFLIGGVIFLLNFYLLDFFSLSRGYGLSCAFVSLSAVYIVKSFLQKKDYYMWFALLAAIVGSYANFTALVYLMAVCLVFQLYFFQKSSYQFKKIFSFNNLFFLLVCIGYGFLIITPILKMQRDNQFKYWTSEGFVKETLVTTIDHFKYGSQELSKYDSSTIAIIISITIVLIEFFWFYRLIRHKVFSEAFTNPVFISNTILLVTAMINILNCTITNTPNLNGRTALLFYPLFSMVICSLLAVLNKTNVLLQLFFCYVIFGFTNWHFRDTFKIHSVREWWFDENTFQVMEILRNDTKCQKINLRTNWLFHPSFNFYVYTGKFNDLYLHGYDKNVDVNSDAEYYYVIQEDLSKLESKYYQIARLASDRYLLKRKK